MTQLKEISSIGKNQIDQTSYKYNPSYKTMEREIADVQFAMCKSLI
jgi:hypothetical protein